ncbi:hypothetical protein AMTRI_Chr12g272240 [Amborella trichopoda]|uniref:AUGMIN subunit 8 n=1 Tax=Amborella trichopoda TaxID=13333 RepID=UPI0005D39AED|nr:AUGMIN subunit 8 [Amborella trichopoda]XP_020518351.1 AUGMIN subunit 8 [Amborella trichopoda]XP_020518352.1 AUGMIN subunit 8 [Amborella trichopoda]XP_020518359.1 AUGMIN subunit 8 [Amborella trichopoda]XP_020518363.1 AUGMIN subunit 8 [Amborella trichopoda]|eukprot:XP_011620596.1 AUGMIN subunit 8 [Amborella trichopoda]
MSSGQEKSSEETLRPPLVPSEKNNGVSRKPKTREVTSRYKSAPTSSPFPSSSFASPARRSPSPNINRANPRPESPLPKRSQSAERRRPSTPSYSSRPSTPSSPSRPSTPPNVETQITSKRPLGRTAEGLWPSTRSLSVSFQADTFSLPIIKRERPVTHSSDHTLRPSANLVRGQEGTPSMARKVTPERKRTPLRGKNADLLENSKPLDNSHCRELGDQQRWPGRSGGRLTGNAFTRSVDFSEKAGKATVSLVQGKGNTVRTPKLDGESRSPEGSIAPSRAVRRMSFDGREDAEMGLSDRGSLRGSDDGDSVLAPLQRRWRSQDSGVGVSRSSSESLGVDKRIQSGSSSFTVRTLAHETNIPAIFLTEANTRVQGRPKLVTSPTGGSSGVSGRTSSTLRLSRSHPASPSKAASTTSSSRGMASPTRTRVGLLTPFPSANSVGTRTTGSSPSVLSFVADVRKGKKGLSQIEEAHQLRLLYNRHLQWRFVNARADTALSIQQVTAEMLLYNVWFNTSDLRDSVILKRIELHQLRQETKLNAVLKEQLSYLDEWALVERDHSSSLAGAIEALEASTLRLPVTGGARADINSVEEAISSAVDVMQAMGASVCYLLSKVEGMNQLVSELANVAAQERAMLDECGHLLAATAAVQVEESSLRTHLIQMRRAICNGEQPNMAMETFV